MLSDGDHSYTWDYEHPLLQVSDSQGSPASVTFKYDPFGRRIQKSVGGSSIGYLYDGADVIEEIDSSGSPLSGFVEGPGADEVFAETQAAGVGYYLTDGLGSVTSI